MIRVALFADLHGRILLAWKLVERYQRETGQTIDLILQCGDMGIFPDLEKLDRATLKYAQEDRSELGFHDDFLTPNSTVKTIMDQLSCNMVCVRGNHEDHEFLDGLEEKHEGSLYPVDCYNRIFMLKTGHPFLFQKDEKQLSIIGIGRIGDRKGRTHGPYIQPYEQAQLNKLLYEQPPTDILLTHDSALHFSDYGYGMQEIRDILNALLPQHHFYGHTGKPFSRVLDDNRLSISWKIKELEYKHNQLLEEGCMLILTKEDKNITVEAVEADWLKEYTQSSWRYID